ncbi:SdrD B-like domain-containing protein [Spirosoma pollinicola]|nr:SdrD B-like domain-containing protein [Spirosoma pollinicola]
MASLSAQAQVSGRVYQDFNANGVYDISATIASADGTTLPVAVDKGIAGVVVNAYGPTGSLAGTATTAADGTYTIAGATGNVRVEFSILPTNYLSGPVGTNSGTSVQFVTAPATNINFGINRPWDYSENNPALVTNCYVPLSRTGTYTASDVIVTVPNNAGSSVYSGGVGCTSCPTAYNLPAPNHLATHAQVGSTFGLGWQASTKTLFAATYIKQFTDIGPQGTGAIYRINMTNPSAPVVMTGAPNTVTGPIDLNLIFGAGTMGANPFSPYPDFNTVTGRQIVGDAVFNAGFSDIDVSEDGKTLYALSFKDKKIYSIPIDGSPINSTTVKSAVIPVISGQTLANVRPTGMGIKDGKVYVITQGSFAIDASNDYDTGVDFVGSVRYPYLNGTGIGTQHAVYAYDPATNTFTTTPVLSFNNRDANSNWIWYWGIIYMDLVFDDKGAMILGGRNISNDVVGGTTGARLVRASKNGSGVYDIEDGGSSGGITTGGSTVSNGSVSNGLYYYQVDPVDGGEGDSNGGLAQIPGHPNVIETQYDPFEVYTAGLRWLNNTTGKSTKAVEIVAPSNPFSFNGVNFDNKAGVLGELEALSSPAPIEIGNRVWNDTNNDGIQNAGETGIAGVSVSLCTGAGAPIATAVTDANGTYYFSSGSGTTTGSVIYSLSALTANTNYQLKFPTTNSSKSLVTANAGADNIDSDAPASGVVSFSTASIGANDHTFDVGYGAATCALSTTVTAGTCTPATNQYAVSGTLSLINNAAGGTATITDGTATTTVTIAANATTASYILTGLTSDAASHTVTVSLPGCGTATVGYTAPGSCSSAASSCSITIKPTVSGCYSVSGVSKATVSVEVGWSNAPTGNITVTYAGQTKTITPGSFTTSANSGTIVSPQVVAFEVDLSTATSGQTAIATFNNSTTCTITSSAIILPAACLPTPCTTGQTGGTVFNDYNANGIHESGETTGIPSVTVKAFDCNGALVGTTTTDQYGRYTFTGLTASNYPIRVEFSGLPAIYGQGTLNGSDGRTTVQFVNAASCTIDLGVLDPTDYCESNPKLVVPCYVYGDPQTGSLSGQRDAVVMFDYNLAGAPDMTKMTEVAKAEQVGTLWGEAYDKDTKRLYMSATLKRHAGLGPLGLGGIYVADLTNLSAPVTTAYIDVTTLGINVGSSTATDTWFGVTNLTRGLSTDPSKASVDLNAYKAIGKAGIGGISLSADGKKLYFTNLYDKKLYVLNVGTGAATLDKSIDFLSAASCPNGDLRPWATKFYRGKVYAGVVCDAGTSQNQADMRAFVYQIDPSTNASSVIFDFPLTYPKGTPNTQFPDRTGWYPWTDDWSLKIAPNNTVDKDRVVHPEPIFNDIEFDIDGSMVLAFGDRTAVQTGLNNYGPYAPYSTNSSYQGNVGGDILRAYSTGISFVLENNAKAGPVTGAGLNNNQGPGFGEFYNDKVASFHSEDIVGGLALLPGSGEVVAVAMDPSTSPLVLNAGGVRHFNNTTGAVNSGYAVYKSNTGDGTYGKATGLGDLILTCSTPTYLEIGNRVWVDTNKDGIQDPCEKSMAGVNVALYQGNTLIATATTDANGEYYFNNNPVSSTVVGTTSTTLIQPNTAYTVRFGTDGTTNQYDNTTGILTTSIGKFNVTTAFSTAPTANTLNDSNALVSGGFLSANVTTGAAGSVNHTIDAGFICAPTTVGSVSVVKATCTGTTANNDGQVLLTGVVCGDKAFIYTSGPAPSYTATGGLSVSASAVSFTGLVNPSTSAGQSYSIIVYNGPCCFTTVTAVLPQQVCTAVPCSISATAAATCNNNGTLDSNTDDYTSFVLTPYNAVQGSRFTITATQAGSPIAITFPDGTTTTSGASMSALSYAYPTPFRTGVGTAGKGNIIITITDVNNATCTTHVTVVDPGTCAPAVCVGTTPTSVSYAYQTPFQTTELANVPLLLNKFDNGGGTRTLTGVKLTYKIFEATNYLFENASSTSNDFVATTSGTARMKLSGTTIITAGFPNVTTGDLTLPAGVTVAAQGTYSGDAPFGTSNVSTLKGMDSWLTPLLQDIFIDPRLDPRWVTTATGNPGNDADIYVWAPQSFSSTGVTTYTATTDLTHFVGSGTIPLVASTVNGFGFIGGGGNILSIQNTKAYACATVEYTYICTVCSLTATATPTVCNPVTNQYDVSGTISLTSNLAGGVATITDGTVSTSVTVGVSATSVAYSLTGLTSDGANHTLTVTLAGCGSATVGYTAPASCTIAATILVTSATVCYGSSATLVASGCTGTITWSSGATGASFVTPALTATTDYTATCTTSTGSTTSAVGTVTVMPQPVLSLQASATLVTVGTPVSLSAIGCVGTVSWPTGVTGASISVTPANPTNVYSATCTTGPGCTTVATTTINTAPSASLVVISATVCYGSSATLVASGCTGTITWSSGATGASFVTPALTATTDYTATCTTSTGSTTSAVGTVTVMRQPVLSLQASATLVTVGTPVSLSAIGCVGTVSWSTGATGAAISVTPANPTNVYSATCTTSPGCTTVASTTISTTLACSLSVTTTSLPKGQVGVAYNQTIVTTGGTAPLNFSVSGGNLPTGLSLNATTGIISGTPTVSGSFPTTITVTDAKACQVKLSLSVFQIDPAPQTASLGDFVWYDTNKNGQQDGLETGVAGVIVKLFDPTSSTVTPIASLTTDASGKYLFTNLTPGQYCVIFQTTTLPVGYSLTLANTGADATDSDASPVTGKTATYTLTAGQQELSVDAGIIAPAISLNLDKLVDKSRAKVGDVLTYTLVLTNTGTVTATNVVVSDVSTVGLRYVAGSASAPAGSTFTQGNPLSTWTIASLGAGQHLDLTFQAIADSSGILYNTATIPGDTARVCTSIPYQVCKGSVYQFQLGVAVGSQSYQWYKDGVALTGASSNTLLVTAAGSYSVAINGVAGCLTGSCCPFIIEEIADVASYSLAATTPTCNGTVAQTNGQLTVTGLVSSTATSYTYQIVLGSSFDSGTLLTVNKTAVPLSSILSSSLAPGTYTVRIYNASGCYRDVTAVILPANCVCPPPKCVPFVVQKIR